MRQLKKIPVLLAGAAIAVLFFTGPVIMLLVHPLHINDTAAKNRAFHDTRRACRSPAPDEHPGAVVQIFAARAWGIRGVFAEHTWIAAKQREAPLYRVYQIKGWLFTEEGRSPLSVSCGIPDRYWMGSPPRLIFDLRGPAAERAIAGIDEAVESYPYKHTYRLWPGPNSNTFTAYITRAVPGLTVTMPATAVGKDFFGRALTAPTPAGSGYQVSLFGLAGILAGKQEGVEINLLGLTVRLDFYSADVCLPGIGSVGNLLGRIDS